ncbi:MAG: UDP-2,3-diacylglucosamine diphosphatase [Tannerella sp.]|jgi:UDP-2,3-diacylglucosamine hydrolase|nr:UDP-2,3-diacylglucosamine diphosphatase [Tannerella sp.]
MPPEKIYFASDVHLGSFYPGDTADREKKLVRWLDRIKRDAIAVYFLGDVFDYWYEYRYVAPRGHVRFLGKLAELSDLGIEIHLFAGNHDLWMFDYFTREFGAAVHREPVTVSLLGKTFFLGHGDEVGRRPLKYRILQRLFRSRLCQALYAAVHPRWTFGLARRLSSLSRRNGLAAGRLKEAQERNVKALEEFARARLRTHPGINFFIFGHLHVLTDRTLTPDARLIVTGDWMQYFSYAEWDGEKLELKTFSDRTP